MPTFEEIMAGVNNGLGALSTTPLGQFGTQMLLASGPQAGNPSGGARLGQALGGMQQMQMNQARMQNAQTTLMQQAALRKYQQDELALRLQQAQREEDKRKGIAAVMQDPNATAGMSPIARQLGQYMAPADIGKLLPPPAKMPTAPGMVDLPVPGNTTQFTRKVWNPQTGQYDESVPFTPTAQQAVDVNKGNLQLNQQVKPAQLALDQSKAASGSNIDQQKLALEQQKAQREQDKFVLESKFKRVDLKDKYLSAKREITDVGGLAREIANDKSLPALYGPNGYIQPVAGSAAANLQTKIDRLQAMGGMTRIAELKAQGVNLYPTTENDMRLAQATFGNFGKLQGDVQAKQSFNDIADRMDRVNTEAENRFNQYDSLYSAPSANPSAARVPTVGTVMDGYRYNGGDPASPQSWSKQ